MKFTAAFIRGLEALNTAVAPRSLLHYQKAIADTGGFTLNCPFEGVALSPLGCHITNLGDPAHGNLGIAYLMNGRPPLWLLASSPKDGFPLTEVYCPGQDRSLWCLGEPYARENTPWKIRLRQLGSDPVSTMAVSAMAVSAGVGAGKRRGIVLLGHPNFAHHLWNELPALQTYLGSVDDVSPLMIRALYEPLLPLRELADKWKARVSVERVENFDHLVGWQDSMVTRFGSTRIPSTLRNTVTGLLGERRNEPATAAIEQRLQGCWPVVWLSARCDARTLENQRRFLTELIVSLSADYPRAGFIIDGFSFPDDFGAPVYQQSGAFLALGMSARERNLADYIEPLRAELAGTIQNAVVSVSGLRLGEALWLARLADYYVCHAGTLQHKVAWFYNTPGMVHSNRAGLQPGAKKWLADQLEDGRQPALVPPELVEDLDSIRLRNQVARNRDYRFVDLSAVIAGILVDIRRVLDGDRGSGEPGPA